MLNQQLIEQPPRRCWLSVPSLIALKTSRPPFERLGGTRITTNIKDDGEEITNGFGLIDSFRVVRSTPTGRMSEVQVRLSDWMFKIIQGSEVLTLSRDYFRLRKPIERRIYEIARKHCGEQDEWRISLELLQKKTGASSHGRAFKAMVRELVEHDHLPDYSVSLDGDFVVFLNRSAMAEKIPESAFPQLQAETFNDARTVAPGYDVYRLGRRGRRRGLQPSLQIFLCVLLLQRQCRVWHASAKCGGIANQVGR